MIWGKFLDYIESCFETNRRFKIIEEATSFFNKAWDDSKMNTSLEKQAYLSINIDYAKDTINDNRLRFRILFSIKVNAIDNDDLIKVLKLFKEELSPNFKLIRIIEEGYNNGSCLYDIVMVGNSKTVLKKMME